MRFFSIIIGSLYFFSAHAQLESGNWYQIKLDNAGVYKVDGTQLKSWGIDLNGLNSNALRLFGNGGGMLPEANNVSVPEGLTENNIQMVDGGDGIFNENDYFLFWGAGPDQWDYDLPSNSFRHQRNLYARACYYYLHVGGIGKRIPSIQLQGTPQFTIDRFEDKYFYENDQINLLKSGREWYGEEFGLSPGKKSSYQFSISFPNIINGENIRMRSSVAARAIGASSAFTVLAGSQQVLSHFISPVNSDQYAVTANISELESQFPLNASNLTVQYNFNTSSVGGTGWLNWFELFAKRRLDLAGLDQLHFDVNDNRPGGVLAAFRLQNADATVSVWNITDPLRPKRVTTQLNGSELLFLDSVRGVSSFIAFRSRNYLQAGNAVKIPNQNVKALQNIDYIIVSYPAFITQAQRLAQWHQQNSNLNPAVVTPQQIFHEFSSGKQDPVAIRNFVRYLYNKSRITGTTPPRYLLLLGDASYDYLNVLQDNTNFVPAYESKSSLDPLSTYVSDDFYGFLDENENVAQNVLTDIDIGIGRIPARTVEEARAVVDKIIRYHEPTSFGSWRNEITLIADDEDNNLHLDDAEFHSNVIINKTGKLPTKIYMDAYRQQSGSGGSRYPDANLAVNNKILSGTLIWNYSGHGGFRRLAEEVILDNDMINTWDNADKLPLFVTATCDFAPYDNPVINSIGEDLLLRDKTGAIALMTTTRVVFAFSNRIINNHFFQKALQPDANGLYPTLGDAIRQTKNLTLSSFGDNVNNKKFTLLGDPAMRIGFPDYKVRTLSVNGRTFSGDTLRALQKYEIKGEIIDQAGNKLSNFNGEVYPVIYDKKQTIRTLGNDPGKSQPKDITIQNNILFKGKTKVVNGAFSFNFIVPKDINYSYGNGLLSYFAHDGKKSAAANDSNIIVGGVNANPSTDNTGPMIRAFLNDENFVNGGIVNQAPVLLLKLFDSSGINSAGAGVGHDISAMVDDNPNQFFVLNDFYTAEEGSFQRGMVRFQLPALEEGVHFINIKVWDVFNNSSNYRIEFRVVKDRDLTLANVYNYPNPFTSRTTFMFEHNRPGDLLQVNVRIFSVAGNLVRTIDQTINSKGTRSFEIQWDGTDHFGQKVGRGVYIYQINVKDSNGNKQSARQKLVLL
ncbi:MAG: type IX secretion system sortase PorU [Bacteroidota bacterium]